MEEDLEETFEETFDEDSDEIFIDFNEDSDNKNNNKNDKTNKNNKLEKKSRRSLSKRFLTNFYRESEVFLNNFLKFSNNKKVNADEYKVKNTLNSTIYLMNNKNDYIENRIDKVWENNSSNKNKRIILKELNTSAYIMSFTNLVLIVFDKKDNSFWDFNLLYYESTDYLFDVYENSKHYYVFCISKYKNEVFNYNIENEILRENIIKTRFINWLVTNDANIKYTILTGIYDSFLLMNKHWNCQDNSLVGICCLHKNMYTYKCRIGKGNINNEINNFLKTSIHIINKYYMPTLPNNYLAF